MSWYTQLTKNGYIANLISNFNSTHTCVMREIHNTDAKGRNTNEIGIFDGDVMVAHAPKITSWEKSDYESFLAQFENDTQIEDVSLAESKQEHAWVGGSRDEQKRTYAKSSYQLGKGDLKLLSDRMINKELIIDYAFSTDIKSLLIKLLKKEGITQKMFDNYGLDAKKTSAFLFKGYYITPSMVALVLKEYLNTKEHQIDNYIKKYDIVKKTADVTLIQECFKDALLHNRLKELRYQIA